MQKPSSRLDGYDSDVDVDVNQPFQELFLNEILVDAGLRSPRRGARRSAGPQPQPVVVENFLRLLPVAFAGAGELLAPSLESTSASRAPASVLRLVEPAKEDAECALCWEELGDQARAFPCDHLFHEDCVNAWLEVNAYCPTCRGLLTDFFSTEEPSDALSDAGLYVSFSSRDSSESSSTSSFSFGSENGSFDSSSGDTY